MNSAQIHLLFNHWPIIATMVGLLLLLVAKFFPASQSRRSGLMVLVLAALLAIPALLSGEGAEEIVEEQGVSHELIHEHEESAEKAFWAMEILGLLALIALIQDVRHTKPGILFNIVIVVALGVSVMMTWVGHTGGLIKHPEISDPSAQQSSGSHSEAEDDHE